MEVYATAGSEAQVIAGCETERDIPSSEAGSLATKSELLAMQRARTQLA